MLTARPWHTMPYRQQFPWLAGTDLDVIQPSSKIFQSGERNGIVRKPRSLGNDTSHACQLHTFRHSPLNKSESSDLNAIFKQFQDCTHKTLTHFPYTYVRLQQRSYSHSYHWAKWFRVNVHRETYIHHLTHYTVFTNIHSLNRNKTTNTRHQYVYFTDFC